VQVAWREGSFDSEVSSPRTPPSKLSFPPLNTRLDSNLRWEDHRRQAERLWGRLDDFALMALDIANNPGKNPLPDFCGSGQSGTLLWFSILMVDLPPESPALRPKLILTKFRPHEDDRL
jgi:hypothetical protein